MSGICSFHSLGRTYSEGQMGNQRKPFRISRMVVWLGYVLIAVLAVPAVILVLLIGAVWAAADRLAMYLEKKGDV